VAQHAGERLAAAPQALLEAQRRHAEHHARGIAALAPHLHTDPRPLVQALGAELSNTTAAWQYAVTQGRADLVLALLAPLAAFFEHRGRAVEGIEVLRPALALRATDDTSRRVLARTRHALAMLMLRKGDARGGLELAETAVQQATQAEDVEATIGARLTASLCQLWLGRADPARSLAAAALADAQALGDRHLVAWALGNLGLAQSALGEHETAFECAQQSLRLARELDDRHRIVAQWANLGQLHMDRCAWAEAQRCFEQGLADCAEIGFVWTERYLRCSLGQALLALGHKERARALLERALEDARGAREQPVDWAAELALARLELSEGDAGKAPARIARVARAAQAAGADYDVALALAAWAELVATRGQAALAGRLIELALAQGKLEAAPRRELQQRLQTLAAPAGSDSAPLTLHEALALIEAEGAATKR
jgi:tetratricopeptide (TPR) repeat protein